MKGAGRGEGGTDGVEGDQQNMKKGQRRGKVVMKEEKFVYLANSEGWRASGLTVHPADADGLAEGKQQQRRTTADMMVKQLQQVHSSLPADRQKDKPQTRFSHR